MGRAAFAIWSFWSLLVAVVACGACTEGSVAVPVSTTPTSQPASTSAPAATPAPSVPATTADLAVDHRARVEELIIEHYACLDVNGAVEDGADSLRYCKATSDFELFSIESKTAETLAVETYGLLNSQLVYAIEYTAVLVDGQQTAPWSVEYILEQDAVLHHQSLGLGETEEDGWRPESILDQWTDRSERLLALR